MKLVSEIILALATVVLAYATIVLAKHTKSIDDREKKNKREEDLKKCILLVQNILTQPFTDRITSDIIKSYGELVALGRYIHVATTRKDLEMSYSALLLILNQNSSHFSYDKWRNATNLKEMLHNEVIFWQRDLGNYS